MGTANRQLYLLDNDFFTANLSDRDKRKLRLLTIFKAVASVLHRDMQDHPWKLIAYAEPLIGLGTLTAIGTGLWIAAGLSETARTHRNTIADSFSRSVDYRLYRNFMCVDHGTLTVQMSYVWRHYRQQGLSFMLNDLEQNVRKMKEGRAKAMIQKALRKKISKGEIVVVSP